MTYTYRHNLILMCFQIQTPTLDVQMYSAVKSIYPLTGFFKKNFNKINKGDEATVGMMLQWAEKNRELKYTQVNERMGNRTWN